MTLIDLRDGGAEPVTVAEAKDWCRIERGDEDALVGALIRGARETVENETGLALGARSFRLCADVPRDGRIAPRRGPVREVTKVTAYGPRGEARELEPATVAVVKLGAREWLVPEPAARRAAANGLEVEFRAGLSAAEVPDALRQALLRIVAASYETRGIVPQAMQPAIVPAFARALIAPFRQVRL
ncbi:head-tail connector protein [Aureimonas populi]|uniref:Phage head-tail connector protein n=1 Tax=Aureimonas populi TaxID=1701758 RepID=A0ABW5CK68_9HYPH|nr:phage head-tail connector protein [Aureimonas populi]